MRKSQKPKDGLRPRARTYQLRVAVVVRPEYEPYDLDVMAKNSSFAEICNSIYLWLLEAWGRSKGQSLPEGRRLVGLLNLELVFAQKPRRQASDEWQMLKAEIMDRVLPVFLGTDQQPRPIDLPFVRGELTFQSLAGLDAPSAAVEEEALASKGEKTDNDTIINDKSSAHEDLLPSHDHIEGLFASLSGSTEERRAAVVRVVNDVTRKGVVRLNLPPSSARPAEKGSLDQLLRAALPEGYAGRLEVLSEAARIFRNEAVLRVLSTLDTYLATHEPQENARIHNPIHRRKDLIEQKEQLALEVSQAFDRVGLVLCCPSGKPGSLKVLANENNPKGQFRLIPRGTGQAEKVRAKLRDLLPFLRFEGADVYWEVAESPKTIPSVSQDTGRGR